ncbi:MAG TPA: hypothetical protein VFJ17_09635 [Mycobacteriales bacterium]|nr:hypothetical protein [Mycobacteriales bacterium]
MTATTPQHVGALHGESRFARLTSAVRGLRTRTWMGSPDKWLLIVGGVLMPLGILLIILGWVGASRTPLPFEQTPYLISGGLLGLGLVFAGGFVYFAYWQTVRIRESREQTQQLVASLGRLEAMLQAGGVAGADGATTATFVATSNGSIFHRQDCTVVAGRSDLRRVDPDRDGLAACRICDPLDDGR